MSLMTIFMSGIYLQETNVIPDQKALSPLSEVKVVFSCRTTINKLVKGLFTGKILQAYTE